MHNNDSYITSEKEKWREYVYSLLSPESCSLLVDKDNNLQYKWLELVGKDAITFDQLLSTQRISEDKLIGLSYNSEIIEGCKLKYPNIDFHFQDWNRFCNLYKDNDIGVFIFDGFCAAHGNNLEISLANTLKLVNRCRKHIGEVLLVINTDSGITKRIVSKKKELSPKEIFKESIEKVFKSSGVPLISSKVIDINTMYEYQQSKENTTMLSCGILF